MKYRWDKKYLYWGLTAFFVIIGSIAFALFLINLATIFEGIAFVGGLLSPFIYGFAFAYLLFPVVRLTENGLKRWFATFKKPLKPKTAHKLARILGIFASLILAGLIITALISMIIPQLLESLTNFFESIPGYVLEVEAWAMQLSQSSDVFIVPLSDIVESVTQSLEQTVANLVPTVNGMLVNLTEGVRGVFTTLLNILVGLIISVYVLYSKERFAAQAKKLLYAVFPVKGTNSTLRTLRHTNDMFMRFFVGKLVDSLIIGMLCFILMTIFQFPFALLISVVIGVTNIVPFFGPFIGAIPCGILLLLEDPMSALYFGILILALQQFDGNILGPKILGDSTGLSSFWVIFAILLGGGLFGFIGMIAGVPIFAVIYTFVKLFLDRMLEKKNLPSGSDAYMTTEYIEEATGKE